MRACLLPLALLPALITAYSAPGLPQCAGNCINGYGGCNVLQVKCICSNTSLLSDLACCVSKKCSAADQEKTIQFAQAICAGQDVTDLPTTATCAATAKSTTTGASKSTTDVSGTVETLTKTTMSGMSMTSTGGTAARVTLTGTSSSGAGAGVTSASSSTPAAGTGAAMGRRQEVGLLGLVAAGLVAAL